MGDEFTISSLLKIDKTFLKDTKQVSNLKISQTGDGAAGGVQNIGTSAEAIDIGDISTPGLCWFRNLAAVGGNYVQIGMDVGGAGFEEFIRLLGGETAGPFRLDMVATGVLQAKADTGAVELQYVIYEE